MAETIELGIVGIKNCGEYDSETNYEKLNVVTYQGSSYCALKDTVGNLPTDTEYWQLYAAKGDPAYFDNVASMKQATNLIDGSCAKTLGYYEKGDGGSALYKIRTITNDDVVDDMFIIQLNNSLIAEIVNENNIINVLQYGIKNDGISDNYSKLNTLVNKNINNLYFPDGEYYISDEITIPNTCKTIKGDGRSSIIKCEKSGFKLLNIYYNVIENIRFTNNNQNNQFNAITGQLKSSIFNNVSILYFDKGINITGGSWVDSFNNCKIENCNYAIYKDIDGALNDIKIRDCNISNNTNALYILSSNQNVLIEGCDMESNNNVFTVGGTSSLFTSRNNYFEGNNNIFKTFQSFLNSSYYIEKCRIYQPDNSQPGWIGIASTVSNANVNASVLTVKDCDILFKDYEIKPFAFNNVTVENPTSYLAFNILNNNYNGTITSNNPQTYFDLIDRTNNPTYMRDGQRLCVKTDLVYNILNKYLLWELDNKGINNGFNRQSNIFHMFGYYDFEVSATSYQFDIPRECGAYTGHSDKHIGTVVYTDGTTQDCTISIQSNSIIINKLDSTKTTVRIILNCYYTGDSRYS